jgi:Sec-independent protein translocase protein TatA
MIHGWFQLAFIGPGGPEFIVIMLVLLMMFGAKDAPRILRKLNEIINQIRNTADGFKREVMYGDLNNTPPSDELPDLGDELEYDDELGYDEEPEHADDAEPSTEDVSAEELTEDEDGDVQKT